MSLEAGHDGVSVRYCALTEAAGQLINEDTCLAVETTRGAIIIVADGVGGQARGEVASDLAARAANEYLIDPARPFGTDAIEGALALAQARLRDEIDRMPRARTMRTTLLIAQGTRESLWIGHVGDCRAYLIRDGRAERLTRDDTLVQTLLDLGQIDEKGARSHAKGNVLLQSLGDPKDLEFHVTGPVSMRAGDVLVACSDGLSDVLEDHEIAAAATSGKSDAIARRLMDEALGRHAPDNVSVGVMVWRRSERGVSIAARRQKAARAPRRDPFRMVAVVCIAALILLALFAFYRRQHRHVVSAASASRIAAVG